jgi:hypothetical protein
MIFIENNKYQYFSLLINNKLIIIYLIKKKIEKKKINQLYKIYRKFY